MNCPHATIFDLDDTLAESFQPPTAQMTAKLGQLLERMPIAIISAAGFERIERDFLSILVASPKISRLYVLPNSSAQCFAWSNGWNMEYDFALSPEDREKIAEAIGQSVAETEILGEHPKYTPLIIDRDVQIAYAVLGLNATAEDKKAWDPDQSKRKVLKAALEKRIPEFEILIGGMTSIDITRKAINKAYGVKWLAERLKLAPSDMLYVGDALYEGGNDSVVIPTGIQTRSVSGPPETETIIDEILAVCKTNN